MRIQNTSTVIKITLENIGDDEPEHSEIIKSNETKEIITVTGVMILSVFDMDVFRWKGVIPVHEGGLVVVGTDAHEYRVTYSDQIIPNTMTKSNKLLFLFIIMVILAAIIIAIKVSM